MNLWGPVGCKKNLSTILKWLKESAIEHGYPFSERVANVAIRKAIDISERHRS
jgi:hypothetical protein